MIHKHKFITYHEKYSKPFLLQINRKDVEPYKPLILKRFETLEEAIKERDLFLSNYKDKRYKGLAFDSKRNKWRSTISYKGKAIYLGLFDTQEEAKEFRNKVLMDLMN